MPPAGAAPEAWVVTSADEAYWFGALVALRSAHDNAASTSGVHLRLLDAGLTTATSARVERAILKWPRVLSFGRIPIDVAAIDDLPIAAHFSVATYARLVVQSVLDCEVALYIDADALVRGDVAQLVTTDLGDALAGAVVDAHYPTLAAGLPATYRALGFGGDEPYFNAGIMLVRPRRWKEADVGGAALSYLRTRASTVRFADQDALNAVLANKVQFLDPRWNVQVGAIRALHSGRGPSAQPQPPAREAGVLHFIGKKPWDRDGLWLPLELNLTRAAWVRTLRRTGVLSLHAYVAWAGRWAAVQAWDVCVTMYGSAVRRVLGIRGVRAVVRSAPADAVRRFVRRV
jgi:lipopolysaccharide biosynthesis glycosyltransferase